MAARVAGFSRLSQYDGNAFQLLYDYVGIEEFLRWIFEEWIEPRVVMPFLNRMDDVMDNVVRSFGSKNFGQHYSQYWQRRREEFEQRKAQLEREHEERFGERPVESENESDFVYDDGTKEKSGSADMHNLNRMAAQLSDVVGQTLKENDAKTGESVKKDLRRLQQEYEKNPEEFGREVHKPREEPQVILETPDQVQERMEDRNKAKRAMEDIAKTLPKLESGAEELMSFRDLAQEVENNLTSFGDIKIDPNNLKTESEFKKQGEERLTKMGEDEENPYVYKNPQEFAMAWLQEKVKAEGYDSIDDLIKAQEANQERDQMLRAEMIQQRVKETNARLEKHGRKQIDASQLPPISDDEFEQWKKDNRKE